LFSIPAIIMCILLSNYLIGCGGDEPLLLNQEASILMANDYNSSGSSSPYQDLSLTQDIILESEISEDNLDDEASQIQCYGMFHDGNGRWAVRIVLENIVAYRDINPSNRFGLTPLGIEFPVEGEMVIRPGAIFDRDWSDYQHRLSRASYHLIINDSLESEINTIIHRNLWIDGVAHPPSNLDIPPLPQYQWLNNEVFEKFVNENVVIDLIGDSQDGESQSIGDLDIKISDLSWQVYQGGCFMNYGSTMPEYVCYQHLYEIWLVYFSDDYRVIWDMKYIVEPGCGRPLNY